MGNSFQLFIAAAIFRCVQFPAGAGWSMTSFPGLCVALSHVCSLCCPEPSLWHQSLCSGPSGSLSNMLEMTELKALRTPRGILTGLAVSGWSPGVPQECSA